MVPSRCNCVSETNGKTGSKRITASKIKHQAPKFLIIKSGWLERGEKMYEWKKQIQIVVDEIDRCIKGYNDEALTLRFLSAN